MRLAMSNEGPKTGRWPAAPATDVYSVLLVDDSDDDLLFMRRALRSRPGFLVVGELRDGEAAIEYLGGQGKFANRDEFPYPDVLLLDLKMPRKTGHEVLEWLQNNKRPGLRVVVLSGSFLPQDITRSRELGADAYFTKEALFEEHHRIILEIEKILKGG